MIADRRTLTYIAIALIVGAALALAVALSNGSEAARRRGLSAGRRPGGARGAVRRPRQRPGRRGRRRRRSREDRGRARPVLGQGPVHPAAHVERQRRPAARRRPRPPRPLSYTARVSVNGTEYTVENGDKVPSSSPAFKISGITSGDVTFAVIDGKLKNGDSSITVNLGESVKATLESGKSYDLSVLSIGQGSGGGGGGSTNGHSISVLSITTSNGTAMCTLEVDGKTYSDLEVGRRRRHVVGRDRDHRHQRLRPDRHRHARRPDARAARRTGRRQVSRPAARGVTATGRPQAAPSRPRGPASRAFPRRGLPSKVQP